MLLKSLKIITIVALLMAIFWFVFEPGFEPAITAIVLLAAIVKLYWNEVKSETSVFSMLRPDDEKVQVPVGGYPAQNRCKSNRDAEISDSVYPGGSYVGSDFSGLDLKGMLSKKADYRGANFLGANLEGAHFKGSNFEGANFKGANLKQVNFKEANLKATNLDGADLSGAFLVKANLAGASIKNTIFVGANLKKTIMPGPAPVKNTQETSMTTVRPSEDLESLGFDANRLTEKKRESP